MHISGIIPAPQPHMDIIPTSQSSDGYYSDFPVITASQTTNNKFPTEIPKSSSSGIITTAPPPESGAFESVSPIPPFPSATFSSNSMSLPNHNCRDSPYQQNFPRAKLDAEQESEVPN